MVNNIYSLRIYYPFLPIDEGRFSPSDADMLARVKSAMANILDMRVTLDIPAGDPSSRAASPSNIRVRLLSIIPPASDPDNPVRGQLQIQYAIESYGMASMLLIPIYRRGESYPPAYNYAIVAELPTENIDVSEVGPEVHPDCLIFEQIPPKFSVEQRYNITADGKEAQTSTELWPKDKPLGFVDGHNVGVSFDADMCDISFAVGAGLGAYTDIPWVDSSGNTDKVLVYADGLASINGLTNTINITGSPYCRVVQRKPDNNTVVLSFVG